MSIASSRWLTARLRGMQIDWILGLIDACLLSGAWVTALILRYDGRVPEGSWGGLWTFLPVAVGVGITANGVAGLYSGVWRHASIYEARKALAAGLATTLVSSLLVLVLDRPVPLSVPLIAGLLSLALVGAVRFHTRLFAVRRRRDAGLERTLVIGAGSAGAALARDVAQRGSNIQIVGFLDDDPELTGRKVSGHPVLGRIADLERVTGTLRVSYVVLAIPSASAQRVRAIASLAEHAGVVLRVVPPLTDLVNGEVHLTDVRDLEISDLLGRHQVQTDLDDIHALVRGKRVLITGAGGSIGSEISRQVASLGAARVVLLDHDETHLFETALTIPGAAQRLADVREPLAVEEAFAHERPDIVFHAAAHKHVPLLEEYPVEAAATNVVGTRTVAAAARRHGCRRFVFISTDKAVHPSSVMGASKLIGEHVSLESSGEMTACAVRFGNVLGSRGSVVPTFAQQIRDGGPVTITHPRMTRYFMTIPEAVRLVLHAAALAEGKEVFMLDMGKPVRILDLAQRMIRLSGRRPGLDIEIRVSGIRAGEKLAEELHTEAELRQPTSHPSILRLEPQRRPTQEIQNLLDALSCAVERRDDASARSLLFSMAAPNRAERPIPRQADPSRMGSVGAAAWI